jgi:hypothetical protein
VQQCLLSTPTILIAPLALVWLVNHPDHRLPKQDHQVLYGTPDRVSTEESKENGSVVSDVIMIEESDDSKNNLFSSSYSDLANKSPSSGSMDDWSRLVVDGIDCLCCDGGVRDPEESRTLVAATRSHARASAETPEHDPPALSQVPRRATKAKAEVCMRGKEVSEVVTFRGSPPTDPHVKWVGQQDATEIPNGGRLLEAPPRFPDGLLVIEDDQRRRKIIVPLEQRERLVKQEHLSPPRMIRESSVLPSATIGTR